MRSKIKETYFIHPFIHPSIPIVPYHLRSIQLHHGNGAKFTYGVDDNGRDETSAEAKHVKVCSEQNGLDHGRSVRVFHDRVAGKVQSAGNANLKHRKMHIKNGKQKRICQKLKSDAQQMHTREDTYVGPQNDGRNDKVRHVVAQTKGSDGEKGAECDNVARELQRRTSTVPAKEETVMFDGHEDHPTGVEVKGKFEQYIFADAATASGVVDRVVVLGGQERQQGQ
jgi:hypothetical protein